MEDEERGEMDDKGENEWERGGEREGEGEGRRRGNGARAGKRVAIEATLETLVSTFGLRLRRLPAGKVLWFVLNSSGLSEPAAIDASSNPPTPQTC
eukprot:6188797-Pleurochrysis_carterae.AAC.5